MLIPVVLAAALMNAAMVAASAVSTIVVAEQVAPAYGGLPNTAGVLGTAAGALLVGRATRRHGRTRPLLAGYLAAVTGAVLAVLSLTGGGLGWLFAGMLLLGAGNAAALLSRYAAAEVAVPARRAAAMSTVVWAGTVGAVVGPLLLDPSRVVAERGGLPPLTGAFLLAVAAATGAAAAISRFRPVAPSLPGVPEPSRQPAAAEAGRGSAAREPGILLAGAVMLAGQLVMVAVMTAVPVHAHHHGDGLEVLGPMLSAHTLGMFALSPLTGRLVDRIGTRPVLLVGLVVVALSALVVAGPGGIAFTPALFALGYGWNLCYLGGSAVLSRLAGPEVEGARVQGVVEAWVWGVSAVAAGASTWLFATGGFRLLAGLGVAVAVPLAVVAAAGRWSRSSSPPEPAAGSPVRACG